jgi:opacity protein-like surface antigen
MKKAIVAASLLCLASALPAAAAQGPYVGLGGGLAIIHDSDVDGRFTSGDVEYDLGGGFNVSAGYKFDQMRLEAEFGYNTADVDRVSGPGFGGDLEVMSYMVNGIYDMTVAAPVTPFFGVGLGAINGDSGGDDDTQFGYQLTAGVTSPINEFLNLDVYYRYQGTASDFEVEGLEVSYDASLIFAGLRYNFR